MTIEVVYPFVAGGMEPLPLRAQRIWDLAQAVRDQVFPHRRVLCVDVNRIIAAAKRLVVNGIAVATHWDLEREVVDSRGREALGVIEADRAVPGAVVVSLNGPMIAGRDYLMRSTVAHELGHALFDGPSMLRQANQQALALVTLNESHFANVRPRGTHPDWREYRANEFMGGFLVPYSLLHGEMVRRAIAIGLPLVDAGLAHPVVSASADPERIEGLLLDLAERFGVSAEFIDCRLRRYALVR